MATKFQIITQAFLAVGASPVQSYDEITDEAALASDTYELNKRAFLSYAWNCNAHIFTLSRELAAPSDVNWKYSFLPPPDWLSYRDIRDINGQSIPYWSQSGRIYTNSQTAVALYSRNLTETDFPDWLAQALIFKLAAVWAIPITADTDLWDVASTQAKEALRVARLEDARQNPPVQFFTANQTTWARAWRGSGGVV